MFYSIFFQQKALSLHRKQKEKESLGSIIINLFPKRGKRKL